MGNTTSRERRGERRWVMALWYMKRWTWWNAIAGAVLVYGWTAWGWVWGTPLRFVWIAWWERGGRREQVGRWALRQCGNWRLASFRRERLVDEAARAAGKDGA